METNTHKFRNMIILITLLLLIGCIYYKQPLKEFLITSTPLSDLLLVDCGSDWRCLAENAYECNPVKFKEQSIVGTTIGVGSDVDKPRLATLEIKVYPKGNMCVLYYKIDDESMTFDESMTCNVPKEEWKSFIDKDGLFLHKNSHYLKYCVGNLTQRFSS